jgi:hypothetical protein
VRRPSQYAVHSPVPELAPPGSGEIGVAALEAHRTAARAQSCDRWRHPSVDRQLPLKHLAGMASRRESPDFAFFPVHAKKGGPPIIYTHVT